MSDSSESDDGPANWNRHQRGNGKNSRKIVMRIEFDDSEDSSSGSETSGEEPIRPSASGRRRHGGKRLISSNDDDDSSGSEIARTVVVRGRSKRKAVIVEEEPAVDEPQTSSALQNIPSSSSGPALAGATEDGFASDSSNDELEKCPICLLSLRTQEIGKPSVCDHLFCAICIEEWARNVRTCPIDRQAFDSIIVQDNINSRKFVREVKIEETQKADFEAETGEVIEVDAEIELEYCRICQQSDREDVMLLCDGCNQGYHMDCLTPPFTEIPEGFWYCDNCFESEEEDIQEDLNVLYEDLREMGIPETRLRVREVRQPRIPRTRQSERIRASIVARTRRSNTRITSNMDLSQPSSSAGVTASTSSTRRRQTTKRRSRRRTGRQRRTYVVEYDVDNFDQKFQIKTTKKVVRKRKSSKRSSRRKRRKISSRAAGTHKRNTEINDFLALRAARENSSGLPQPRFSLFGGTNDLEYFSDESDSSVVGGDSEVGRGAGGGASIQTSIRIHSFSTGRSLARRKGMLRDLDRPREPDILSSILDMQDRFHSATQQGRISEVTIGPDGTLNLPSKKNPESEQSTGGNSESKKVPPSDINQAPMYPRGGGSGGNNYNNNNSGGSTGGGGYNNRFNNQSNYRNSTGGGGGQFRSGNFGGSNGGNSGGFLFNAFRRDNNNFQSDNSFQQNNRMNNSDNSTPNRGRFRQNQNQQQRRNQNNQNRYSGPPNLGGGNDMNQNRNLADTSANPFNDGSNVSRPAPTPLFGIGSMSLFSTPTKPLPSDPSSQMQTLPLNFNMSNSNPNLLSVPLHRPPPPILPVYGPMNITGPDPPPTPDDLRQNHPNNDRMPQGPVGPAVAPLAPPPWNQNLFRLTSDYADSNDEDDDDSNCPNFSVYSAESFQVARSSENTTNKAADSTTSSKVDSDSVRQQEDDYEEKEEDLVQLDDDDDIPDALEKGKESNAKDSKDSRNETNVPESEIYEPEFPTAEPPDDDEDDENEEEREKIEDNREESTDETAGQVVYGCEPENKGDNEASNEEEGKEEADEQTENSETSENKNRKAGHEDEGDDNIAKEKAVSTVEKSKRRKGKGKGVLELYDDSDWEEWNIEKTEFIPMPPGEPQTKPDIHSSKNNSDKDISGGTPERDVGDATKDHQSDSEKGGHTPEKEADAALETDINTQEDSSQAAEDGGCTPELDEAKLQLLKKQTENISEEEEQERSYTPCLDEKTEHDEANGEGGDHDTSHSDEKDKADESRGDVSTSVIDGLEMELISEEDEDMLNDEQNKTSNGQSKGDERNKKSEEIGGKRSRKEQFKKISKSTKERNYRDKDNRGRPKKRSRSKSRSRSRSNSRGKENRNRQRGGARRNRRKEIERYNVRNVIGQPRTYKDRYGRDTSRPPRSRSRSRSRSFRRLRTKSRTRSVSPRNERRSFSMSPTPVSAGRLSPRRLSPRRISPPARRLSPRRRGYSPRRSRSRSRRRSRSLRRSSLPRRRSRTPLRLRSRSPSIGRPSSRRNQRLRRRISSHSGSRSRSCSRSLSKYGSRSRSPAIRSPRRSHSRSPLRHKNKGKRSKDRRKKRTKKRPVSMSPASPPVKHAERAAVPARKKKKRVRSKSPVMDEDRWSQSPEPMADAAMMASQPNDSSWTPPLIGSNNDNLTVILKNKNAAVNGNNRKKRERKKKGEKRREIISRKEKRRQRSEMRESPVAPSKEVFASGNNILVSVSFNKDNNPPPPTQTTVVTLPPTREEIISKRRSVERQGRKQKKSKEKGQRRRKKVDAKPVAIIDLDRSPFQVIAQSPRDIIVLTDESDREGDEEGNNKRKAINNGMDMGQNDRALDDMQLNNMDKTVEMQRPNTMEEEESFEMQQLGPKTPPDPPSTIKFSLAKTKQIKVRNPLHDEQEEMQEQAEAEHPDDQIQMHSANKIGPNTPPESGPCSPDAYDPFDPTKSPSMSPSHSPAPAQDSAPDDTNEKISHVQETNAVEARPATMTQEKNLNPVDLVMALINTKASMSQQEMMNMNADSGGYTMKADGTESMNMVGDENNAPCGKNITVLSNVLISKPQNRTNQMLASSPPISKSQSQNLNKLPKQSTNRQNGGAGISNDEMGIGTAGSNDPESPYSPGSADYEDLFEPPPPTIDNSISLAQLAHNRKANKAEIFDNLFGSTSPADRARVSNFTRRKSGKSTKKTSVKVAKTKLEDDQIKIFDELPSSAVELQVKDKFLRKLNRQERVVEEVKLVLKPHYNRKRITKEDYKEILRRSVPKICHSRSGEINPAKIKNLIEAYVKKFRQRNKLNIIGTGQVSSAVKCAAYLKKL